MALAVATAGRLRPSLCLALRLYLFHPGFHDHLFNWFVLDDLFRYGGRFAALAASTALVPVAAIATTVAVMAFHRRGKRGTIAIQPFAILADQLFDLTSEARRVGKEWVDRVRLSVSPGFINHTSLS